jgi:hypothetical protein
MMGGSEGIRSSADAWLTHREEKSRTVPEIIEVELR